MGVAEQHPGVPVAAEQGNLGHRQALLEEPADDLVAQVVEGGGQGRLLASSTAPMPA